MRETCIAAAIGTAIGLTALWGLYEFTILKYGPLPPCEVSNTCHWFWR